jgi:hypothetical protein
LRSLLSIVLCLIAFALACDDSAFKIKGEFLDRGSEKKPEQTDPNQAPNDRDQEANPEVTATINHRNHSWGKGEICKEIWPPDRKMISIDLANDYGDCFVQEISSNEAESDLDDEDVPNDLRILDSLLIELRAERDLEGPGRIYSTLLNCSSKLRVLDYIVPQFEDEKPTCD